MADSLLRLADAAKDFGLTPRALKRRLRAAEANSGRKLLHGDGAYRVRLAEVRDACPDLVSNGESRHRAAAEIREMYAETASRLDDNELAVDEVAEGSWYLFEDLIEKIDRLHSEQIRLKARVSELERAQTATTATTHRALGREVFSLPTKPEGVCRREKENNGNNPSEDTDQNGSLAPRGARPLAAGG